MEQAHAKNGAMQISVPDILIPTRRRSFEPQLQALSPPQRRKRRSQDSALLRASFDLSLPPRMRVLKPEMWAIKLLSHCLLSQGHSNLRYHKQCRDMPAACCPSNGVPRHRFLVVPMLLKMEDVSRAGAKHDVVRCFASSEEAHAFAHKYSIMNIFTLPPKKIHSLVTKDSGPATLPTMQTPPSIREVLPPAAAQFVHAQSNEKHKIYVMKDGSVLYQALAGGGVYRLAGLANVFVVQVGYTRRKGWSAIDRDGITHKFAIGE